MAQFYIYLISSLPSLHYGARPPFSFDKFLENCSGLIPEEELDVLKSLPHAHLNGFAYSGARETIENWYIFETNLRNELVRLRASRKKADPAHYLRREQYAEPSLVHLAQAASRASSSLLLDAEKMLDEERWRYLDELSTGHYFDLDFLITYAGKLLILERWHKIASQDKHKLLEEALSGG